MKKISWRPLTVFVLMMGLLVTLVGCGGQSTAASADVIKVGIILPLTGSEATFGNMEKNAFEMAYEELKAAGKTTIGGKSIQLLFEDDQGKQDVAKSATEKLVNQDKVAMLSGAYSSASTNVIAGAAQSMNIPILVTTGSADDITKKGWEWVFRGTAAPASKYTVALWEMLDQVIKPKTAAIVYESTDFGKSSATGFRAEAEKRGIEIVYDQPYEAGAIDFKPMLAKVKNTNPDMVFAVSYLMDASMIVKQSKELDFNTKLLVGGGAGYTLPEFKENAGEASEYIASSTLWVPSVTWPGAKEFFDNYVKKFGKEPDYHGAQAYATMHIIVDALNRAQELNNTGIQKALKETELTTIMGPIKFEDWEGYTNQSKPYTYVVQWQQGKLEVIWPEAVKSAPHVYPVPNWGER
ncbi:ABC transporter substrate-binding protein [Desulfitobacterium chlororespirans]|uniref:Amino acid/amide ABC transporter substrate-binding protein, HAAT family n=1 Tax=Desulfitobacterium chlororespirans DSM 11544 TaxID=1121395 RepID=A0A1M7UBP4_9FIRM|nr:ABC transporter substrate-binding protein [Desulfitobacterium chlororespirans]SHN80374.1 amino acid/amide ABC transporter substrate-binding protein, HAAT family [Desulfitobacterium chlororespirans DSM 11544]